MRKKELNEILAGKPAVILVDDKIEGAVYLPWHSLLPFQGNLKFLSPENEKKMLLSLIEKGFFDVKKVWRKGNEVFIADGHQTLLTLTHFRPELESGQIKFLRKSDKEPTDLIPCVFINAENEADLAAKLLLINSEYGEVTAEGITEFKAKHGISDAFLQNIAIVKEWNNISPTWNAVNPSWSAPPPIEITDNAEANNSNIPLLDSPPQEFEEEGKSKKDLPSGDFVEYPIIFAKEDYDFWVELVKRVKKEQLFEKNSQAIIHIARQYDTYVGSL